MIHNMKLVRSAFPKIANGSKTIGIMLNDEKRQKIIVGDTILFECTGSNDSIYCEVAALHKFKDFAELYNNLPIYKCGYDNINVADPADMLDYYTEEQIGKYGVLGIEIGNIQAITDVKKSLTDKALLDLLSLSVFNPTTDKLIKRAEKYMTKENVKAIAFSDNGNYIALCVFEIIGNSASVLDIGVKFADRNKKVGSKLIDFIRDKFGVTEITAETDDDAVGFYQKYGFVITETAVNFDTKRYTLIYKAETLNDSIHYKLTDNTLLNNFYTDNVVLLDWDKDIEKIRRFYSMGFGIDDIEPNNPDDFESVGAVAYIKNGEIISFADIMKIRQGELEIGAVATLPKERNKGYSTKVVSFAAQRILEMGFIASLTTKETNYQMRAVAKKLGFTSIENVKKTL